MMSNSFGQWLLVQWSEGGNTVINIKDLFNKKHKLCVGDTVQIADRRGIPKQGTLLKISDRKELLLVNNMEVDGFDTNHKIYSEPEERDYSGSSDSWKPEKTYVSSEDEEEVAVQNLRIKTEQPRRSYGRKGKKSQTPTLRPTPIIIIPKNLPSSQFTQKPTKDNRNMRKNKTYQNRTVQAMADSTRKASASPQIPKTNTTQSDIEMVIVNAQDVDTFKKELEYLSQMILNTKETLKSLRSGNHRPIDQLYETVYPSYSKTVNGIHETEGKHDISQGSLNQSNVYEFRSPSVEPPNGNIKHLRYGVVKHNKSKNNSHVSSLDNSINDTSTPLHTLCNSKTASRGRYSNSTEEKAEVDDHLKVPLGTGTTFIPKKIYDEIKWSSYTMATRKLLMAVFPRRMLATHSLTGKASPAFMNKPAKLSLDPKKVFDIVLTVTEKCKVKESLVRSAITTKCADENKMLRMRKLKDKLNKSESKTPLRHLNNCDTDDVNQ